MKNFGNNNRRILSDGPMGEQYVTDARRLYAVDTLSIFDCVSKILNILPSGSHNPPLMPTSCPSYI
jgi:hypothetical protein